jgi:hypothetical protein
LRALWLSSGALAGDLAIGRARQDDVWQRLHSDGLVDLLTLDASDFRGNLSLGASLDADALRHSDGASLHYSGGSGDDNFHLVLHDALTALAEGQRLTIDMGEGDDQLSLQGSTVSGLALEGGAGHNTLIVAQSHGTTTDNSFASFNGFSHYVIEAPADSAHDFSQLPGLQSIQIASPAPVSTTLKHLGQDSQLLLGVAQQAGGTQHLGQISLYQSAALSQQLWLQPGADGQLQVDSLQWLGAETALQQLSLVSQGAGSASNSIQRLQAAEATEFVLRGDQALHIEQLLAPVAPATALQLDAAALLGGLYLGLEGQWLQPDGLSLLGNASQDQALNLRGALQHSADAQIRDFNTLHFGADDAPVSGSFDAAISTGVEHYVLHATAAPFALHNVKAPVLLHTAALTHELTLQAAADSPVLHLHWLGADIDASIEGSGAAPGTLQLQDVRELVLGSEAGSAPLHLQPALSSDLVRIDLSGLNTSFSAGMMATSGSDLQVQVGAYDLHWRLAQPAVADNGAHESAVDYRTLFSFDSASGSLEHPTRWTLEHFISAYQDGVDNALGHTGNYSQLDLAGLGVSDFGQLALQQVHDVGGQPGYNGTLIEQAEAGNWQILLLGVAPDDLQAGADLHFNFA